MKTLKFLILFLIVAQASFSQTWEECLKNEDYNYLNCIRTIDSNIFVGSDKGLFYSSNNGESWEKLLNQLSDLNIISIEVVDKYLFAGTLGSGIFRSNDFGKNWINPTQGVTDLKKVYSIKANKDSIYICSANSIYFSNDFGFSWKEILKHEKLQSTSEIAINGKNICVGAYCGIFSSSDGGSNWKSITSIKNGNDGTLGQFTLHVASIAFLENKVFAGGYEWDFLYSSDYGFNWSSTKGESVPIMDILVDNGLVCLGTHNGFFLKIDTSERFNQSWRSLSKGAYSFKIFSLASNKDYFFADANKKVLYRLSKSFLNPANVEITGISNVCNLDTVTYFNKQEEWTYNIWDVAGGEIVDKKNDSVVKIYWNTTGIGKLTLKKINKYTDGVDSSSITISINDIPEKPVITILNDSLFSNYQQGNQWYKNGDSIIGATGQNYYPLDSGNFTVKVTISGCTSEMSEKYWVEALSVEENSILSSMILSSNPVHDYLEITKPSEGSSNAVRIFNVFGEIVKNPTPTLPEGEGVRIDVSGLPSGVYFVKVGEKFGKFVKI